MCMTSQQTFLQGSPLSFTMDADEETVLCFRCGKPAVGRTSIGVGTKDRVVLREEDVAVCEDCYAVLKEKVRTRSRLSD